ncbi:hypothetical protein [Butyrivibrio sp. LC3010]|uniref:hypothetical protein n=1 Tax=Butyrivibrio sp. LC3010 TaxID=1280680 RepID=UPI00041B1F50|nr:hypothetical protein [Butyrivibrio sp. LC3010]
MTNDEIKKAMKDKFKGIRFPRDIDFIGDEKNITVELKYELIKKHNMQVAGNAFEGWAIAIHMVFSDMIVRLSVDLYPDAGLMKGHWARFIYRAMKFSEQYEWFRVSEELASIIKTFKTDLDEKVLVNNIPTQDAKCIGEDIEAGLESEVEDKLARRGILHSYLPSYVGIDQEIHRQLPVGLFEINDNMEKIGKKNAWFTYGHSAIDLWNINGDAINVIELKARNRMIGIVTEIFFYTNFVYDFVMNKKTTGFIMSDIPEGVNENELRGYSELYKSKGKIRKVNGIMLVDDDNYHPCVTKDILVILNDNGKGDLNYFRESYHLGIVLGKYSRF